MNQHTPPPYRRWLVAGIMAVGYGVVMSGLAGAWYGEQLALPFHFFDDGPEWKQLDKLGHLFTTFQLSLLGYRLLRWAGYADKRAATSGTLVAWAMITSVEIGDGFSAGYGASVYDVLANTAGALLFLAQRSLWNRLLVWPKFSFHFTSYAVLRPSLLGDSWWAQILKDYNGQTYWYSLPLGGRWSWLMISVGLGAEGMIFGRDAENLAAGQFPYRRLLLSLDLNLEQLAGTRRWLRWLSYPLAAIKFPAPALEISTQGIRFHALHF